MAFTAWEFIRGALLTYVIFLPLTLIPFVVMFAGGLLDSANLGGWLDPEVVGGMAALWVFMLAPAVTWGFAALWPGALGALAIGLALRRESRLGAHLLAHCGWGLVVGLLVAAFVLGLWPLGEGLANLPTVIGFGIAVALASGLGWQITAGLALRRDARVANTMQDIRTS